MGVTLLLDTHALLWAATDPARLSARAADLLADPDNVVLASTASAWELAIKHAGGRLAEAGPLLSSYEATVALHGFAHLDVRPHHALAAPGLESDHRDPFDRMLAAQAILEDAVLVTADPAVQNLPGVRWAW